VELAEAAAAAAVLQHCDSSADCDKDCCCGCDKVPYGCYKDHCGLLLQSCWQNPQWSSATLGL